EHTSNIVSYNSYVSSSNMSSSKNNRRYYGTNPNWKYFQGFSKEETSICNFFSKCCNDNLTYQSCRLIKRQDRIRPSHYMGNKFSTKNDISCNKRRNTT